MRQAAKILTGRHDFASFQGSGASVKTTIRNLQKIQISRIKRFPWPLIDGRLSGSCPSTHFVRSGQVSAMSLSKGSGHPLPVHHILLFDFIGDGFLKQMVRNIVGTLVEVGRGALNPEDVAKILKARDRKKAGLCAPPQGLYLMKVIY
jgi:tRNA pseudouridine38-40 synthase